MSAVPRRGTGTGDGPLDAASNVTVALLAAVWVRPPRTHDPDEQRTDVVNGAWASGPSPERDAGPAPLDHRDPAMAAALVDLQRAAYRVETELIGIDRIPPLYETPDDVAGLDLSFLAMYRNGLRTLPSATASWQA